MKNFIRLLLLGLFLCSTQNLCFSKEKTEIATFGGGCFWCMQSDFDTVAGVISTEVGYMGGNVKNPTYKQVSKGNTGHVEVVQVVFDPNIISYEKILDFYFHNIDPTRNDGQFCDTGNQYRPVIFYHSQRQRELANAYKSLLVKTREVYPILVDILPAGTFYPAEEYHQQYYIKRPYSYKYYRYSCGRDAKLKEIWGNK